MKICPNCNNMVADNSAFCDKCGARFTAPEAVQAPNYQQPVNNSFQQPVNLGYQQAANNDPQQTVYIGYQQSDNSAYQQPVNTGYQQPVNNAYQQPVNNAYQQPANNGYYQQAYQPAPSQPKKKNGGLVIGIVVAVLAVLAIIGISAEKVFQNMGSGSSTYEPSYSISYNNGILADGVYTNEWANIRFDAVDPWTDGTDEEYAAYEGDPNTECGVILDDAVNGKQLSICFEKLTGANVLITADTYLDIVSDGLGESYNDSGLPCQLSEYYDTTIAGETYRTLRISFDGLESVQDLHVRKHDGYIIFIGIVAQSSLDADLVANNIHTMN